jgi:hypothetical protein
LISACPSLFLFSLPPRMNSPCVGLRSTFVLISPVGAVSPVVPTRRLAAFGTN